MTTPKPSEILRPLEQVYSNDYERIVKQAPPMSGQRLADARNDILDSHDSRLTALEAKVTPEMVEYLKVEATYAVAHVVHPARAAKAFLASLDKPQPVREAGEEWPKWYILKSDGVSWLLNHVVRAESSTTGTYWCSGGHTNDWEGDHSNYTLSTHAEAIALIPAIAKDYPLADAKPADEWPSDVVKVWQGILNEDCTWREYADGHVELITRGVIKPDHCTAHNLAEGEKAGSVRLIYTRPAPPPPDAGGALLADRDKWKAEAERLAKELAAIRDIAERAIVARDDARSELSALRAKAVPEGYYLVGQKWYRRSGPGDHWHRVDQGAYLVPCPPPPGAAS